MLIVLKRIGPLLLIAATVLGFSPWWSAQADAKQRYVQDDLQTWQLFVTTGHLTRRFLFYLDTQNYVVNLGNQKGNSALFHNENNQYTHEGLLQIRPALGFQVNKTISVWQGYGWTPSYQPQFRNENQLWEQMVFQHRFKALQLSSRSRLEIRYIANAGGTALRFRNQFRAAVPLGKSKWSVVVSDEPFWNWNSVSNGPQNGFNQNWLFAGFDRQLTDYSNVQFGYLNNYVHNFYPANNRMNHVLFVGLSVTPRWAGIDLRKSFMQPDDQKDNPHHQHKGTDNNERNASRLVAIINPHQGLSAMPHAVFEQHTPNLEILPLQAKAASDASPLADSVPVRKAKHSERLRYANHPTVSTGKME